MKKQIILAVLCTASLFFSSFAIKKPGAPVSEIRVIYFLSPACKICQYYTLRMRELHHEYASQGVLFEGSVPGPQFDSVEVDRFRNKYRLPFKVVGDTLMHRELNATVTPEVFVTDASGRIFYHGRIDDSYVAIGKRKARVSNHELSDALDALLRGDTVMVKHVPAVGCIIEK